MQLTEWLRSHKIRVLMSLAGVLSGGVCVGFMKLAAFGVDPFQALMAGLNARIPISFGTLYVIVNAVLLIFSLATDRRNIGIATFINLFLLGYVVDFTKSTLDGLFPVPGMLLRVCCLVGSVVVLCFGSSLYMTAALGVSTYDAVAIVISGTWHLGKFKYVRICTDLVCVILGAVLYLISGGVWKEIPTFIGIGTIVTAFFMGPLISFFNEKFSVPFLRKYETDTVNTVSRS